MSGPDGAAGAWLGGAAGDTAYCVLAPNPGPMTLDGTNTWVLGAPGGDRAVVVDPGPLDEGHLGRVLDAVRARGARVSEVLLTHGHRGPQRGRGPLRRAGRGRARAGPGPGVPAGRRRAWARGTSCGPGTSSSGSSPLPATRRTRCRSCVPADGAVLTGDTVLGRGTTVVAYPDGRLAAYLESLDRLLDLTETGVVTSILPGHGPVLADARRVIEEYLEHRSERLEQVREAVAAGARSPREVVETVYADVDRAVWPSAELSVRAQLEYLEQQSR